MSESHEEKVGRLSHDIGWRARVRACMLFYNGETVSQYTALQAVGIDEKKAKELSGINVIWAWYQDFLKIGILRIAERVNKEGVATKKIRMC